MKSSRFLPFAALAVAAAALLPQPASSQAAFAAVDETRLRSAERDADNWMSHGRTYGEQRFSPLDRDQPQKRSVSSALAWFADLDTHRGQEATPLVVDGVLYVSTAWSKVKAYDAATGKTLWAYDPAGARRVGASTRAATSSIAASRCGKARCSSARSTAGSIALDAATGQRALGRQHHRPHEAVHDHRRAARGQRAACSSATAARSSACAATSPRTTPTRASSLALLHRAGQSGRRLRESDPRDGRRRPGTASGGRSGGGGTVWDSMAYDPELDLLYIGVGNGSPWNHTASQRGQGRQPVSRLDRRARSRRRLVRLALPDLARRNLGPHGDAADHRRRSDDQRRASGAS